MSNESAAEDSKQAAPESSQMRWQFIDASDNSRSNLTQVKRHVMQEYMRQKRDNEQDDQESPEPTKSARQPTHRQSRKPRSSAKNVKNVNEKAKKGKKNNGEKQNDSKPQPAQGDRIPVLQSQTSDDDDIVEEIERYFVTKPASHPYKGTAIPVPGLFPPEILDQYTLNDQSSVSEFSSGTPLSSTPTSPFNLGLSPKSILSAARTDPFNSLPMDLGLEGQRLFDFYVNEMPACSYGSHFRSHKAHNWYTAVFVPEGMKGPVAFQNTILVHAANTWAWVRNEQETEYTLAHRNRSISMLRDHMAKNPGDISDQVIIASLSAAGLEDFDPRPGRKPVSWVHMRAAREMIRARGGPAAFEGTRLGMLINWQDYILSGYETNGPSFFFEHNPLPQRLSEHGQLSRSISSVPITESTSRMPGLGLAGAATPQQYYSPTDELQHQCDEFIDFLRRCEQLAFQQQSVYDEAVPSMRRAAFQENALLYQIISAPPGLRFTASGNRKQFVARLVALIMLNAGLWDYRFSIQHSETFLQTLQLAILDSEVDVSGSVEALLQIMLECNDGTVTVGDHLFLATSLGIEGFPDYTQYSPTAQTPFGRPWFAGRMLKVAKRLGLESWMNIHDFLFSCLTLQPMVGWIDLWEDVLREEILGAPLTSYIMPSLAA
ncbi:sigma-70 region 2 family protein [Aspergillus steynii IBT 23096]|uniref:Sigma-70 region 2 family protein n=1 Tax=Aspergillus steynii IBT 23096 TaxID=1392250 RepID=A0A2I2GIU8_9EURO|nr:sigma-70 region 2 family protein [Aspergillus steynii IBT 23096]PLB52801.1 sigma-70 region 2 family protein [Aspergillus steynii IBT 23096]